MRDCVPKVSNLHKTTNHAHKNVSMKVMQREFWFVCENVCMQIVCTQMCVYMVNERYPLSFSCLYILTYSLGESSLTLKFTSTQNQIDYQLLLEEHKPQWNLRRNFHLRSIRYACLHCSCVNRWHLLWGWHTFKGKSPTTFKGAETRKKGTR